MTFFLWSEQVKGLPALWELRQQIAGGEGTRGVCMNSGSERQNCVELQDTHGDPVRLVSEGPGAQGSVWRTQLRIMVPKDPRSGHLRPRVTHQGCRRPADSSR